MRRPTPASNIGLGLLLLLLFGGLVYILFPTPEASLTRELSEEKSFFKHAGALFRLRPQLRGQKGNLETWDEAEAIVSAVHHDGRAGDWATWSDRLAYLPDKLRLDPSRHPMCVIKVGPTIYVVRGVKKQVARCDAVSPGFSVSDVRSGELAPSSDHLAEIYYQRLTP